MRDGDAFHETRIVVHKLRRLELVVAHLHAEGDEKLPSLLEGEPAQRETTYPCRRFHALIPSFEHGVALADEPLYLGVHSSDASLDEFTTAGVTKCCTPSSIVEKRIHLDGKADTGTDRL